jgi:hypothetical protein
LRCVYAGDVRNGQDALAVNCYGAVDAIITNPPYTRPAMHRLIAHLARITPMAVAVVGLGFYRQAAPFVASCSDIVAIGP